MSDDFENLVRKSYIVVPSALDHLWPINISITNRQQHDVILRAARVMQPFRRMMESYVLFILGDPFDE